jgi:hypothetical protein
LPQETLRAYLYGDLYDVLAGRSDLGQFAQRELLAYSTSFISRQIERGLGLDQFAFGGGGSDQNPFFVSVEKELSPDLYLAYFRTFYTETQQKEELTLRYRFFHTRFAGLSQNASLAVGIVRRELQEDAVEVELQYNVRFGGRKRDPEEVAAARAAAEAGQPLSPEQQRLIRDPDAPPANPVQETKPLVVPDAAKEAQAAQEQAAAAQGAAGQGVQPVSSAPSMPSAPAIPSPSPAVPPPPPPGADTPDGVTENVAVEIEIKPPPSPAKKVASARQP